MIYQMIQGGGMMVAGECMRMVLWSVVQICSEMMLCLDQMGGGEMMWWEPFHQEDESRDDWTQMKSEISVGGGEGDRTIQH